jgi:fluoride exporter
VGRAASGGAGRPDRDRRGSGWSPDVTEALAIGFLGAFSTFSTFAVEMDLFLRTYRVGTAVLYVLVSLGVGVAAAAAGHRVGAALD